MAKKFFYVCAGLFLIALSYHLGARNAQSQAFGTSVAALPNFRVYDPAVGSVQGVVMQNGDVYGWADPSSPAPWQVHLLGNLFTSISPTATTPQTWGEIKHRYRK